MAVWYAWWTGAWWLLEVYLSVIAVLVVLLSTWRVLDWWRGR